MHIRLRKTVLTGTAGTALLIGSMAGVASADTSDGAVDFDRVGYREIMRSAAIEPFTDIPRHVPTEVGYSLVSLIKDVGVPARCEANGGIYWLDEILEEGVVKGGAAPISEGQDASDGSLYDNYTVSRSFSDASGSGIATAARNPAVPSDGNGPLIKSECSDNALVGSGTGDVVNAAGVRIAGSTTSSSVDEATGVYTSTGRAYVTGLDGAFDTLSSVMQVKHSPASPEPRVTYRTELFNSEAGNSGFTNGGFVIAGTDVPAGDLVDSFNDQAAALGEQAGAVGPLGARIFAPETYRNQDNGFLTITSPVVEANAGAAARAGTAGQNTGLRLGSVTWQGDLSLVD